MKADPYYVAEALVYLSGAIAALEQPVVGTVDVKAAAHWCRQTANMLDSMAYDMDKSAEAEEAARIAEEKEGNNGP